MPATESRKPSMVMGGLEIQGQHSRSDVCGAHSSAVLMCDRNPGGYTVAQPQLPAPAQDFSSSPFLIFFLVDRCPRFLAGFPHTGFSAVCVIVFLLLIGWSKYSLL